MSLGLNYTYVILDVLDKLSSYDYVINNAEDFRVDTPNKFSIESACLFSGVSSLALLFGECDKVFPDKKFNLVAHMYMKKAIEAVNLSKLNPGVSLSTGISGIAFALQSVRAGMNSYSKLQSSLNSYILSFCQNITKENSDFFDIFNERKYDLMFGLCGVLNYMDLFLGNTSIKNAIKKLISIFISKVKINGMQGYSVKLTNSILPQTNKNGHYINLGMSHGITPILILLIKFYKQGIILDFHKETISIIANWLLKQRKYDSSNLLFWPSSVYLDCEQDNHTRDAWCYGTPGISYSLLLAGKFLNEKKMIETAVSGMEASLKRKKAILSPTFCHGWAGLYFLSKRFYFNTSKKYFKEACRDIQNKIFNSYNFKYPFGFVNVEEVNGQLNRFNHINLLSGVCGVLLTLVDDVNNSNCAKWEKIFLVDV